MTQIPYAHTNNRLSVKVDLLYAAEVYLLDSYNFQKYQNGLPYNGYGGYYTKSPVIINVQGPGRWYLIVEGNGEQYKYEFY